MWKSVSLLIVCLACCAAESFVWQQQSYSGTPPSARYDFSYGYDPLAHHFIIFGGCSDEFVSLDDMFIYNTHSKSWSQVAKSQGAWPDARQDAAGVWIYGAFYLFGGTNQSYIFDEIWKWTPAGGWHLLGHSSQIQRYGFLAPSVPILNSLFAFGGTTPSTEYSGQLLKYDLGLNVWEVISDASPSVVTPPGRLWFPMVYDYAEGSLVVFGGWANNELQDLWLFNIFTHSWKNISVHGSWPYSRSGHAMVYNVNNGDVYLFGGENVTYGTNDLWKLSFSGAPFSENVVGSFVELTGEGGAIGGRLGHSFIQTGSEQFLVFGGRSGWGDLDANYNDVWVLSVNR